MVGLQASKKTARLSPFALAETIPASALRLYTIVFFFRFARIRVYSTLRIKRWYKDGGPTEDWFAAAENGDKRAVLRLLGSRPTLLKVKDGSDYCKPALHKAAFKNGHEESGWMLLKQVVVADTRDDNNCSLFTVLLIMVCRLCIFYVYITKINRAKYKTKSIWK